MTPAAWTVAWAEAETQVAVTGPGVTVTIAPAGPLTAAVAVSGEAPETLPPPDAEVIYPAAAAALQPSA